MNEMEENMLESITNEQRILLELGNGLAVDIYFNAFDDSDNFYEYLYYYFYKKGFVPIILSNTLDILSLILGLFFSIFIFHVLDWSSILQCGSDISSKDCGNISLYFKYEYPNFFSILLIILSVIFILYKFILFVGSIKDLYNIHMYYKKTLKINQNELQTIHWKDILLKMKYFLSMNFITNKILKKENYFVALFDKEIIKIPKQLYTKQLDYNIEYIIFEKFEKIDSKSLKKKFIFFGIINLIFLPIILLYQIMHFFVKNVDEFYISKNVLGPRRYSIYSKRKFRQYNELDHFFEERLNKSMKYSLEYIKQFPAPIYEILGKFFALVSGCFVGFFIILSILDENILLYVKVFDRSILFYTAIISAISSYSRSLIRSPEESIYNPKEVMEKVNEYIMYKPPHWKNKENTYVVRDEFISLFPYILILFFYDILSVFTTPYFLLFVLPKQASDISSFLKLNSTHIEGIGSICSFAHEDNFNYNQNDDKMKKSIYLFKSNHSLS